MFCNQKGFSLQKMHVPPFLKKCLLGDRISKILTRLSFKKPKARRFESDRDETWQDWRSRIFDETSYFQDRLCLHNIASIALDITVSSCPAAYITAHSGARLGYIVHTLLSNPIQSNLYCENTADKTQRSNSIVKKVKTRKSKVMSKPVLKSVGVFIQQSNNKVFSS